MSASETRKRLYHLVDEVHETHEPVQMIGKRDSAVLVLAEDWRALQETLELVDLL